MPPKAASSKKRRRRSDNEKTLENDGNAVGATPATTGTRQVPPSNVAKCATNARTMIEKWLKRTLDKGVNGLREEFSELKRYCPPDMRIGTFNLHWESGRNRYKDVPCQDKYRVVLKWPGQTHDYIHANYVATPVSDKRFICTQGPLESTIVDFWHMTIQEETDSLIMLCNCKEKGMDKCAQYWPLEERETKVYGDIEVTNLLVRELAPEETSVRLSVLQVKWQENTAKREREIRHYHWIDWPDRGVPPCRLTATVLLSCVRGTKKPIIVHCGTIVAIEFILERLQSGFSCEAMDEILKELRNQRPYSIQTDLKYKVGNNEETQAKYKKFVEEYDKATS